MYSSWWVLTSFVFPLFLIFLPSPYITPIFLTLYIPFIHCSYPCLLSCSECSGTQNHQRPGTRATPGGPSHPGTCWPHHHAPHTPDPDRRAKRLSPRPRCCSYLGATRPGVGRPDLRHAIRISIHTSASYVHT